MKTPSKILLLSVLMSLIPFIGNTQDITTGLVLHYEFENTSGDVIDAAGSHNGTNHGCTRGIAGKIGNAINLDGSDYVEVNSHSDITNYSEFTLTAWIYRTDITNHQTIISKVNPDRDFQMKLNNSFLQAQYLRGSTHYSCHSVSQALTSQWVHLAVTWKNNEWNIYFNGVLEKTCSMSNTPPWAGGTMQIGAMDGGEEFYGSIDEVRVYNRELSSADITALYNYDGTSTTLPALSVGDVNVNEGAGTATFTITSSEASSQTVSGSYATSNGTAIAGSDYTAKSGTFTILAGQTSTTVDVAILEDSSEEQDEKFSLTISNPTNAILSDAIGDCTILDNDVAGGIDCSSTITNFPYSEGFESSSNTWTQASGDDGDWTRKSGSTGSSSTGPSGAQEGDYYYYTEASTSGIGYPNKTAILESPCFDLSGKSSASFSFYYHMYGSAMGTLALEASTNGTSWVSIWSLSGDQGDIWEEATVDLSSYLGDIVKLRFHGTTGSSYRSDMSVDNVSLTTGSTNPGTSLWTAAGQDIYYNTGKVGIGTTTPDEALTVAGNIHAEEVVVETNIPAPDYVFEEDYKLRSVNELESFIKQHNHLPDIPSAKEMEEKGVRLSDMNLMLLKRIEELTLYVIEQEKRLKEMESANK